MLAKDIRTLQRLRDLLRRAKEDLEEWVEIWRRENESDSGPSDTMALLAEIDDELAKE